MRRLFLAMLAVLLGLSLSAQAQTKRAFIVGVGDYEELPDLIKTTGDAQGYTDVFGNELGFQVTSLIDPDQGAFLDSFDAFLATIEPGDEVIFVFSGHGWADGAENYLALTDAPMGGSESRIKRATVPLAETILAEIDRRKPGMVFAIIDACRDNPFDTLTRDFGRGLVPIVQRKGTLVLFAAGTRQKALDRLSEDDGSPYSVFTRTLLPKLRQSDRPLLQIVDETRDEVESLARTIDHPQRPAAYNDLPLSFCLAGRCRPDAISDEDTAYFISVTGSEQTEDVCQGYQNYLDRFPEGKFRVRIGRLLSAPPCVPEFAGPEPYPEPTTVLDLTYGDRNFGTITDVLALDSGAFITGQRMGEDESMFVARLDAEGKTLWDVTLAAKGSWHATLASDGAGGVYVGQARYRSPDVPPESAPANGFTLSRFSGTGQALWSKPMDVGATFLGWDFAVDDDAIWIAGSTRAEDGADNEEPNDTPALIKVRRDGGNPELVTFPTDLGGQTQHGEFQSVVIQTDGSMRAVGYRDRGGQLDILIAGMDPDGRVFSDSIGKSGSEFAGPALAHPDGGLIVIGAQETGLDYAAGFAILVLRIEEGGLVMSMSEVASIFFAAPTSLPDIVLDADGGAWLAGFDEMGENSFWQAYRVEPEDRADPATSYTQRWARSLDEGWSSGAEAVSRAPDGTVWMAGSFT